MNRFLIACGAYLASLAAVVAQVPYFPQTLPADTVVGRLGSGAGPTQAIPFATLQRSMMSGVILSVTKDCGAKADNSTDDGPAFNRCLARLSSGGQLTIPVGQYKITTPIVVPAGAIGTAIRISGESKWSTYLNNGNLDTTLLTIGARPGTSIDNLYIVGCLNPSTALTCTVPAVKVSTSASLSNLSITGGYYPLHLYGAYDSVLDRVQTNGSYGLASLYVSGPNGSQAAGIRVHDSAFNNSYVGGSPAVGASLNAWASTHAYTAGDIVTVSGYYIQATVSGTSGGTTPTLKNFGYDITDGTVTWQLICKVGFAEVQIDSNVSEIFFDRVDTSGAADYSFAITNTIASGTAPYYIHISDSIVGGPLKVGIYANAAGQKIQVTGTEILGGVAVNGKGLQITSSWLSEALVWGNVFGSSTTALSIEVGSRTAIYGNTFNSDIVTTPISIAANITDFAIGTNTISSGPTNGIVVAAGTSDYYSILGNTAHVAVSDGGTGTHKITESIGNLSTVSLTSPLLIGGTTTTSSLTYKTTTGVGTTGADHIFQVGNNGATEAMRILNSGNVGIGKTAPSAPLGFANSTGQKILLYDNGGGNGYGLGIAATLLQIHASAITESVAFGYGNSSAFTEYARFGGSGNFGLGVTAWGTNAAKVMGIADGTAPTTSPASMHQYYSIGGVPKWRTSAGNVITAFDAADTIVGKATTDELTNKTLTASVGKGTWTASGTWTLPAVTLGGAITYGGVTLSNAVTGTGNMVLATSPTIATPVINSAAHVGGTWVADATWTLPALTLGGTVSGGGQQLNNIIIGTSTPLAGSFTTVSASTSVTSPLIIGGSGTTQTLIHKTTTGVGAAGADHVFQVGNNGATEAARILNSGNVGIGTAVPSWKLSVFGGRTILTDTTAFALGIRKNATESGNFNFWIGGAAANDSTSPDLVFSDGGGTERFRFTQTGGFSVGTSTDAGAGAILAIAAIKSNGAAGGIGYATGAGGTVTQGTNKTTAFTLSKITGQITFATGALAAGATAASTWTNTSIAATDTVVVSHVSGGTLGAYHFNVACGAGTATMNITNISTGSLTETPTVTFTVIKGVSS